MKKPSLTVLYLAFIFQIQAQVSNDSKLFMDLLHVDSILFEEGYNNCNIDPLSEIIHLDFIMYHDQSGVLKGKEALINAIENGICNGLSYKASRRLLSESVKVFPLHNNGKMYGAIQRGIHQFYAKYEDKEDIILTSTARFTHLWLLEKEGWLLKESLSFDHISPGK